MVLMVFTLKTMFLGHSSGKGTEVSAASWQGAFAKQASVSLGAFATGPIGAGFDGRLYLILTVQNLTSGPVRLPSEAISPIYPNFTVYFHGRELPYIVGSPDAARKFDKAQDILLPAKAIVSFALNIPQGQYIATFDIKPGCYTVRWIYNKNATAAFCISVGGRLKMKIRK
jgi:hypothetical protein